MALAVVSGISSSFLVSFAIFGRSLHHFSLIFTRPAIALCSVRGWAQVRPFTQRKDTCDFKSRTSAKQLIHHVYLPNFSAASRLLATSNKISAAGCS